MPKNTLQVEEIKVSYDVWGDLNSQNKLLVVHGWNEHGTVSWQNFNEQFKDSKDFLVVALDMPAFGQTKAPSSVWGVEEYANFLFLFIQELNKKYSFKNTNWSVLGHSFGGAVVLNLSVNYPEIITKLILVSPAITREYKNSTQTFLQKLTKFGKGTLRLKPLKFLSNPIKNVWYKLLKNQDYNLTKGIKRLIMQKIIRQDQQDKLELIKTPTLIIWGDKDKFTPIAEANVVHDKIVGSKLVILPGINHGVHLHAHKELFAEVTKFLNESKPS
jgi:pimeloyl-ACP methyl ester carboxylesterase